MNIIDLHHQAEKLREQEKFLDALKIYEEVFLKYQAEKNYFGLADSLLGKCLTYKHLWLTNQDPVYIIVAKNTVKSAIKICKIKKVKNLLYRCYFNRAEIYMLQKKYTKAIKYFQKTLDNFSEKNSETGRFLNHLGEAQYLNGDEKLGLINLKKGLELIRQYASTTNSFLIHVWETGVLMKLAYFLKDKKYLSEAENIILSDDRLIIRKRQIEELKKEFK
jgi:tetratricopeptide (TPR) repeat protein